MKKLLRIIGDLIVGVIIGFVFAAALVGILHFFLNVPL